jgi:hypothetical protein
MDGTFIPLDGNLQNRRDLKTLAAEIRLRKLELVYVTGRHFELLSKRLTASLRQSEAPYQIIASVDPIGFNWTAARRLPWSL